MSNSSSKINPLIATAAVAVIIFSAVGIGVMTGVIPSSKSSSEVPTGGASKAMAAPGVTAPSAPTYKQPVPVAQKRASAPAPQRVAVHERSAAASVARICAECGVIDQINMLEKKGDGSGLGAVGGAVVGGLLGNQIGKGRGNTAATVVGAVGGAVAGHEVEKRVKSVNEYQVTVRMDNGNTRNFTFDSAPGYVVGEKVKVIDSRIVRS